jgi:hypothetical protein
MTVHPVEQRESIGAVLRREGRGRYGRAPGEWYSRWYSKAREWYFWGSERMMRAREPRLFSVFSCRRDRFRTYDPYRVKVMVSLLQVLDRSRKTGI